MDNTPESPTGNQPEPSPAPELTALPADRRLCPNCGALNAGDARFCYKCGQALPETAAPGKKSCPGCGTINEAASQYCLKCGLKLPDFTAAGAPLNPGGFWIRLGAIIIDSLILGTVASIITTPFYLPIIREMMEELTALGSNVYVDPYVFYQDLVNSDFYSRLLLISFVTSAVQTVIYCAYYTFGVGKWGTTIGKTACGLKVVRGYGARVSYWRAFARYWARLLNNITLGLSYLIIAFSSRKQGIHDMMCDTLVVKKN